MTEIEKREQEIIEEFGLFDDSLDRYEHIIDQGRKMTVLDEEFHRDEFLVKGCQSKVWLRAAMCDGLLHFEADSNTAITKGIVALLLRVLNDLPPADVVNAQLGFIDKIQLRSHLSSQRSNGLSAMISKMKSYAAMYAAR